MSNEVWQQIPDFPAYSVSTWGRVCNNETDRIMSVSRTNFGHMKITLYDVTDSRRTMSVALLVAEAFVEPPDELSDNVILLDGDLQNVVASNLALRPRWFAWKYTRQLRINNPSFHLIPIYNVSLGRFYPNIFDCGTEHGLLFSDILRSANAATGVYPYGWQFEFPENMRV